MLSSIYLLALYLPMVVAAGGNTGGQAATMVIRAMSLGELEAGSTAKVIAKELFLGIFLGGDPWLLHRPDHPFSSCLSSIRLCRKTSP